MKKVLLRAPLLTNSGYGVHSRQVFSWLHSRDDIDLTVECLQWGRTSWILDKDQENGIIRKIMDCSKPLEKSGYDYSFQVQLPDEWNTSFAKVNIGITALVETDRCTQAWVDACNKMDRVILPSSFSLNVLRNSGIVTTRTHVIPEWFNEDLLNKSKLSKVSKDERFEEIKTDFNILIVGTITSLKQEDDRKNLANTIRWACEEFSDNSDVGIILKVGFGKGSSVDKRLTRDHVLNIVKGVENRPPIYLVHGNMKKEEIAGLVSHRKVKAYATCTRGEGYGLPLIEAGVAGIPIVATGWSGHLDFLDADCFESVDYDLVDISKTKIDNRVFAPNSQWAEPLEASYKKGLRKVYSDYPSAKEKAKIMQKNIQFNFNRQAIKSTYDDFFRKVTEK